MARKQGGVLRGLLVTFSVSVLLIAVGLVYFIITLWMITTGSKLLNISPSADFVVLAASLISIGSVIGSALSR
ncbi:MAG: hypothetical protein HZB67_02155 [Candidatus Aenigmarchaeota archaeon]|nr:hypothetical protein [Candidatus Aenigmarchaeota archaeon]